MIDFTDVKAMTFDCYGTLIDWEAGIVSAFRALHQEIEADDEQILSLFAAHEHMIQKAKPSMLYSAVLCEVYCNMTADLGVRCSNVNAESFAWSAGSWPPFTDTVSALSKLSERFRLVIVSNVDLATVKRTLKLLTVPFYRVFTAEETGYYKPDTRVFEHMLRALDADGIARQHTVHVAQSLYHDHMPAAALNLSRVWIDRRNSKQGHGATPAASPGLMPADIYSDLITFANAACRP